MGTQEFHQLEVRVVSKEGTIPISGTPASIAEGAIQVPWQVTLRGDAAKVKVLENNGGVVHPWVPEGLPETY
jgi:hypothetical protein